MIITEQQSLEIFLAALNDLDEPYRSVALAAIQANTPYKLKCLRIKYPDHETLVPEAHQRLRVALSLKGITKLADLPL